MSIQKKISATQPGERVMAGIFTVLIVAGLFLPWYGDWNCMEFAAEMISMGSFLKLKTDTPDLMMAFAVGVMFFSFLEIIFVIGGWKPLRWGALLVGICACLTAYQAFDLINNIDSAVSNIPFATRNDDSTAKGIGFYATIFSGIVMLLFSIVRLSSGTGNNEN